MAKRGDRTCFVCRKGYHYCLCHGGNPNETWRFLFCSDNCRSVEKVWEEYFRDNLITKAEAVARLSQLDTSRIEFYRDQIRDDLMSIVSTFAVDEDTNDNLVEDSNEEDNDTNKTYSE